MKQRLTLQHISTQSEWLEQREKVIIFIIYLFIKQNKTNQNKKYKIQKELLQTKDYYNSHNDSL